MHKIGVERIKFRAHSRRITERRGTLNRTTANLKTRLRVICVLTAQAQGAQRIPIEFRKAPAKLPNRRGNASTAAGQHPRQKSDARLAHDGGPADGRMTRRFTMAAGFPE